MSRGGPSVSEIVDSMQVLNLSLILVDYIFIFLLELLILKMRHDAMHKVFLYVYSHIDVRKEESACFSCWAEMVRMPVPTQYTTRLLNL